MHIKKMREMIVIRMTRVSQHPHAFVDLQHKYARFACTLRRAARSNAPMDLNEWAALMSEIEMLTSADEHALGIGAERVQQITLVDRTTNVTKVAPLQVCVIWKFGS